MFSFTHKLVQAAAAVTALLTTEAAAAGLTQTPAAIAALGSITREEAEQKAIEFVSSRGGFEGLTARFGTFLAQAEVQAEDSDDSSDDEEEIRARCRKSRFSKFPVEPFDVVQTATLPPGLPAVPFIALFEPGATPSDMIPGALGLPVYPDIQTTWRLMYEYNFPKLQYIW